MIWEGFRNRICAFVSRESAVSVSFSVFGKYRQAEIEWNHPSVVAV